MIYDPASPVSPADRNLVLNILDEFPDLDITRLFFGRQDIRCRTEWENTTARSPEEQLQFEQCCAKGLLDPDELVIEVIDLNSPIIREVQQRFPQVKLRFEQGYREWLE